MESIVAEVFNATKWSHFWPRDDMTPRDQQLAMVRFVMYLSSLLCWYYGSWMPLVLVAISMSALHVQEPVAPTTVTCTRPTPNNPYMNVLMSDLMDGAPRAPACEPNSVAADVAALEDDIGYRDQDDLFDRKHSFRAFHTQPNTEFPHDQTSFLNYMYPMGTTCKEKSDQCSNFFELLQAKRQM